LSRLVDGLMALARAERGTAPAEALALAAIVSGRLDAWSAFADEHAVRLAADLDQTLTVRVAPGSVEQALDNLIANAIDVSPRDGAIVVDARLRSGFVEVRVTDDGPGMTDEQRARALDRFWRASAGGGGSGLGLAIVRQLIEADGGTVGLEAASGGGLCVVLRLRAAEREARGRDRDPVSEPA
ncbi:MAG: HAMP domain-containing sensor histidine kinase, partial [Acidimicrobiia bacterium]